MTVTIWGTIADAVGAVVQQLIGLDGELRHHCYAMPASSYARTQPGHIPLDIDHEQPVGVVRYLERDEQGRLHAVCEADDDAVVRAWADRPPRFSSATRSRADYTEAELTGLALVDEPASVALPAVRWAPGDIRHAADWARASRTPGWLVLERALQHTRHEHRSSNGSMLIVERRALGNVERLDCGMALVDGQPIPTGHDDRGGRPVGMGPVEWRPATILSVGGRLVR